ncbi:F420-0--gamma-glutamyl ligase [Chromobacterium violaceum]|uniref:F420-0--gamma-glutamyl ligase n=1 Tax=Chromobacterium violaceum TaxID=536 RepID=A0A3S4JVK4_CHRVL|nr:F420-0--gamma-glutamyl ligase [Chromobacterium violaceum]
MSRYPQSDIDAVYRAIRERRDMRHFKPDPVDPDTLQRLLAAAHCAPSVGFMQPWRFIRIRDMDLRHRLHALVEEERVQTARALGEREEEFMKLKVEGLRECGEVLVAALMDGRERHLFGRRTLPEMDLASVACAIQNMWLAAAPRDWPGMGVDLRSGQARRLAGHAGWRSAGGDTVHRPCRGLLPAADAGRTELGAAAEPGRSGLPGPLAGSLSDDHAGTHHCGFHATSHKWPSGSWK